MDANSVTQTVNDTATLVNLIIGVVAAISGFLSGHFHGKKTEQKKTAKR